jgi:hypothetical protein
LGDAKSRSADVLGHVFEYFLGEFALVEGKKGGQFYTPRSVVELLVERLFGMSLQVCPTSILRHKKYIFSFVFVFVFGISSSILAFICF